MRGLVTSGLLVLLAAGSAEAQPQPSTATTGRDLLAAGDPLGAAEAFQESLRAGALSGFTVQLAIYCDVSNLERQVGASGNPPELLVLRRSLNDRPCLGLYWGLFGSRDEARAAVSNIPGSLRASGQGPVALSAILPPGEPAPSRLVTAPPPRAPIPTPAPAAAVPAPEAMPAAPAGAVAAADGRRARRRSAATGGAPAPRGGLRSPPGDAVGPGPGNGDCRRVLLPLGRHVPRERRGLPARLDPLGLREPEPEASGSWGR